MTNRSMWRNFPRVSNERWVMNNTVLLGDAKATAHFSIGSGTKLAMEDAIALYESIAKMRLDRARALKHFETSRREDVEKTQHAADVSLVWFEHVDRFWEMDPRQFAFGLMTRSKAITWDNLQLRAPEFVEQAGEMFAQQVPGREPRQAAAADVSAVQAARNGDPEPRRGLADVPVLGKRRRAERMASRASGQPRDRRRGPDLYRNDRCFGRRAHLAGLRGNLHGRTGSRRGSALPISSTPTPPSKICLQLGHAGRKGATKLMWEGIDEPLERGAWPIIAPSPLPYYPHSVVPREMTRADMDKVKSDFVAAARRAERAGFDMLELHCAHGYLLATFISPLTNQRGDEYGGTLDNRLRFPLEVFRAIREAWPNDKPMSVRISATDWKDGGDYRRGLGRNRARLRARRLRPDRCLDRTDCLRCRAGVRPHVPDAVFGPDPQRGQDRDHVRRQHHHGRSGEYNSCRRPRGSCGARAAASGRSLFHDARGGLVRRRRDRMSAAIFIRQRSIVPYRCARPRGSRGTAPQGEAAQSSAQRSGEKQQSNAVLLYDNAFPQSGRVVALHHASTIHAAMISCMCEVFARAAKLLTNASQVPESLGDGSSKPACKRLRQVC
jgi:hypothetical protein